MRGIGSVARKHGHVRLAVYFVGSCSVAGIYLWYAKTTSSAFLEAEIAACARSRWKIENEGFNVMKNHGYEFEHNFGHGEKFLAMTLAAMNLLAFAWHTALDILEPPWIAARQAAAKRKSFFEYLATITAFAVFPSWPALIQALTTFTIPPELLRTRKIE